MKLGSETVIELTAINGVPAPCLTSVVGSSLSWISSDPSVAVAHGIDTSGVATVTALSPGDTQIFAEGVTLGAGISGHAAEELRELFAIP